MGAGDQRVHIRRAGRPRTLATSSTGGASSRLPLHVPVPKWDEGCPHCSFWADNFDGIDVHLAPSRCHVPRRLARAAREDRASSRSGWGGASRGSRRSGSDFNFDYHVSFTPEERESGTAFYNYAPRRTPVPHDREGVSDVQSRTTTGSVFHTYSYLRARDRHPQWCLQLPRPESKGRDEDALSDSQAWVRPTTGTTSSSGRRGRRSPGLAKARALDGVRAVLEVAQADGLELRRPDAHAASDPRQVNARLALGRDWEAAARLGVLVDADDGHPREPPRCTSASPSSSWDR